LDTFARLAIKQVYGREELKLPGKPGEREIKWNALAALRDWHAHPEAWDDREIILVDVFEYRPFKRRVIADEVQSRLAQIASRPGIGAGDKSRLEAWVKQEAVSETELSDLYSLGALNDADREAIRGWLEVLGEGRKWISSSLLESSRIRDADHMHTFHEYFMEVVSKAAEASKGGEDGRMKLSAFDKHVYDVGERWLAYQAFRDANAQGRPTVELNIVPRPINMNYLKYITAAVKKIEERREADLTELERDTLKEYTKYFKDIRTKERKLPGTDPKLDDKLLTWLGEIAGWVPANVMLETPLDELQRAGFDRARAAAFQAAWTELIDAEKASADAGSIDPVLSQRALDATRELSESTGARYPSRAQIARETFYNRLSPFARAPIAYGAAFALLLLSLGVVARPGTGLAKFDRLLYGVGIFAFAIGVALEAFGFYLRVAISGWAPVTAMYDTVIWVAFVVAILALVFEAIYRKKIIAIAGSAIALLATLLAANLSLLDPNIRTIQPVLRDNFWLTVHVLTIVSSYAAFALAFGLGLFGTCYYLTASYRRDPSILKLASPALLGVPLAGLGVLALLGARAHPAFEALGRYPLSIGVFWVAMLGIALLGMGVWGLLGEAARRAPAAVGVLGLSLLAGGGAVCWLFGSFDTWATIAAIVGLCTVCMVMTARQNMAGLGVVPNGAGSLSARGGAGGHRNGNGHVNGNGHADHVGGDGGAEGVASASFGLSGEEVAVGGVATLARPKASEILAKVQASAPAARADARMEAMQATAARVKPLSNFIYRTLQVGVLLVATGTILGGVWADVSWGRFWGWDPKEVWALITLLIYLIPLHGRFAGWVNTFWLVAASVLCFGVVLMSWYGVNFVLGVGLHSYGFTEGGGQGVVMTTCFVVASAVFAAAWRRFLSNRVAAV
jgi:ABC-type transport system involved in cytochrome c biogenesis permease subunit